MDKNDALAATETYTPRPEIHECGGSVLAQTAAKLQLHYRNPEQLRLDAVFSREDSWFPIIVAIEHENAGGTFDKEITKLLSVRCPLKVGITYTWSWCEGRQKKLTDIERTIKEYCREISENIEKIHEPSICF